MRSALAIAAIGLILMGATLVFPPIDESTRCTATLVAMLGMGLVALGTVLAMRAMFQPSPPSEED